MSHKRGPLLWTIAIYALSTTCSMKMAKELPQQQHLQLGYCLFHHFTTTTTTLNSLLLLSLLFSFHLHSPVLSHNTSFCVFSHSLIWTVLLTSISNSTNSSCLWQRMSGKDTMNGLFHAFLFPLQC